MSDKLLTTAEAAEIASVHRETVRRWVRRGWIPARYIPGRGKEGREVRISEADLWAFLDGDREEGADNDPTA